MLNFRTPWWLRGAHLQTTFPHVFRKVSSPPWFRERIELNDGDFVDIDALFVKDRPVVVLIHGLEGSSSSTYVAGSARYFWDKGWGVVALNLRSCGGTLNRSVSYYHSGFTKDVRTLLGIIRSRHASGYIFGMGFSLGGNILLRYLGESEQDCLFDAAMAISTPMDLSSSARMLRSWQARLYEKRFLRLLKRKVQQKEKKLRGSGVDIEAVMSAPTLHMFDRHLTAPTFGFRDEEDYYHSASSLPVLSRITIPTHILQSHDDPMLSELCYPEPHSLKSNISCLYTQMGGHVGFVHGSLRAPRFFVEEEAFRFFTAQID